LLAVGILAHPSQSHGAFVFVFQKGHAQSLRMNFFSALFDRCAAAA
jgi:hypothetical protein